MIARRNLTFTNIYTWQLEKQTLTWLIGYNETKVVTSQNGAMKCY